MLPQSLAFVDIETTGGSPTYDRVIEVGVLRVEEGKVVSTFSSLINPHRPIPEEILGLTGISRHEVEKAPSFREVAEDIYEQLENCYFVAHNVRFDYSFLKNEFKHFGFNFQAKQICTVKMSRYLYPQYRHHNLTALIERFGFECKLRHRGFDDAKVLWQFYQQVLKSFPEEQINEVLKKILLKPSMPIKVNEKILEGLPECPGVYIFYGGDGVPLYVGKSINIRKRVLQHFAADYLSGKEMKIAQQVESIETIPTAGEMGALLLEASMIKRIQPLYNAALRYSRLLTVAKGVLNKDSYRTIKLEATESMEDIETVMGIFKSKKSATEYLIGLSKEFELCERLLGTESTNGPCFGYRLGRCRGACVGKEPAAIYNLRLEMAFAKTRLRPWPYARPILIKETDSLNDNYNGFLVDKWCLLGSVKSDGEFENVSMRDGIRFDYDTYKILNKFLRDKKRVRVKVLTPAEMSYLTSAKDEVREGSVDADSDVSPFTI